MAVCVLGEFNVSRDDQSVRLPMGAQRVIAWLVTHPRAHARPTIAGQLWPDLNQARSTAAMRSALWALRHGAPTVVEDLPVGVCLATAVEVDLWTAAARAKVLYGGTAPNGTSTDGRTDWEQQADHFADDLLPHWPDEWLVLQRERHRQVRLHALERLARALIDSLRPEQAVEVALVAVDGDPLRESAQRILIEAHVAEGNLSEAMRQYRSYQRLLRSALGIDPSPELAALLPMFRRAGATLHEQRGAASERGPR